MPRRRQRAVARRGTRRLDRLYLLSRHIGLSPPSRQPTKFQQSSLRLEVLACRKRRTSCFPHMALAPRSVGAASGTDAGRCLAGSLGAARLPTRRRAAMAPPQRLPLLGSRPGAAEIGAPSHRLQHPRGTAVLPTPPRPANSIRRAVVKGRGAKCRRRRAVPLSDVWRPAGLASENPQSRFSARGGAGRIPGPSPQASGSRLCVQSRRDASSFSSFAATTPASNGPNDCLAISHLASRGRVTPSLVPRVGA